jgi:hypothetical protein
MPVPLHSLSSIDVILFEKVLTSTMAERFGIGIWSYPLRSVIFVIVYGYPLGIRYIYDVRTVMRTTTY